MAEVFTEKIAQTGSAELTEGSVDPDAILVAKVQDGDVSAFDTLVSRHRERLFSIIYNLTSNRDDASDLTQDAFIKAFRSIKKFRGKSSFTPGSTASRSTPPTPTSSATVCAAFSHWRMPMMR